MKNTVIVCLFALFSMQTHGTGKWRKRFSRFLPFIASKAHKLEKQKEEQLTEKMASLSNLELVVLDLELRGHADNVETLEKTAQLAREEIYRRISQSEQVEILKFFLPTLKARPSNILSDGNFPKGTKGILQDFLSVNAGNITALVPTPKHLQDLTRATQSIDASIKILQEMLDRRESADEFFAVFEAIAWASPSKKYRKNLDKFFTDNAKTIGELPLTAEQVKHIRYYIYKPTTAIVFLEGALKRARGDADEFFAIFKAITAESPSMDFQEDLNQFFTGNAEAIGELPLTAEQVKHIRYYIYRPATAIVFLEGALKRARGDADKFFTIFKAVSAKPPRDEFRSDLNQFFTSNAKTVGEIPLSAEQVKYIRYYIFMPETAIVFLEGALKRARGDADKFFAIFKAITAEPPRDIFRANLNQFFTGNAEAIGELPLSAEQVKYIRYYIYMPETAIVFLEGALKQARGDADKFFAIFKAVTAKTPNRTFQDTLNRFFVDNVENILDLDPSMAQMEKVDRYLPSHVSIFDMAKNRRKNREVCAAGVAALLSLGPVSENNESEI